MKGQQADKPTRGKMIYYGERSGTVMRYRGPFAVEVLTHFERPEQDFLSAKVTVVRGLRHETWPLRCITSAKATQS